MKMVFDALHESAVGPSLQMSALKKIVAIGATTDIRARHGRANSALALGHKSDIRPTSFGVTLYWSIDELLAHYFSVRPLLNGDLAHFKRSPVGMIGIDAVNNERFVA